MPPGGYEQGHIEMMPPGTGWGQAPQPYMPQRPNFPQQQGMVNGYQMQQRAYNENMAGRADNGFIPGGVPAPYGYPQPPSWRGGNGGGPNAMDWMRQQMGWGY